MDINLYKNIVFSIIDNIRINNKKIKALQKETETPKSIPCLEYGNYNITPKYCIHNTIAYTENSVEINCWHKSSAENTVLFQELSKKMVDNGFKCVEVIDKGKTNKNFCILSKWSKQYYE